MAEPYVFSFSELDTLRQCPMKWLLAYGERWQREAKSPALQRGTDWHATMATLYSQRALGVDWKRAQAVAWKRHCVPADGTTQSSEQLLLEWMLTGYVQQWGGDQGWEILAVEVQHEVPIAPGYALKVRADLLVRSNRKVWLVDAKTSKDLPDNFDLEMHVQFPLYVWALRRVGIPIWGTIHDCVRTQRNKVKPQALGARFRRTLIYHSDARLNTIARDAVADVSQARRLHERRLVKESAQATHEGRPELPVDMPRHPHQEHCRWRCDFTEPCIAGMHHGPQATRRFLADLGFERNQERH